MSDTNSTAATTTTTTTAAPFSVPVNVGPLFFAGVFDSILFGVLITQMLFYFTAPKRDPTWIRVLVGAVMVTELAHTTFNVGSVYIPLVAGFGDYVQLLYANWASEAAPFTTGIVASLVQTFFAWRIKVLTHNMWLVCIIWFFTFVQFCGSLGTMIAVIKIPFSLEFHKFQQIVVVWCVGALTADLLITSSLVYHLKNRKSGIQYTDSLIDSISRMMMQTNLLTFIWNIVDLILYLRYTTTLHLVFNLTITKLYSLSLMISLNARDSWKRDASSHSRGFSGVSEPRITNTPNVHVSGIRSQEVKLPQHQQIYIGVEAHEMVHVDDVKSAAYIGDVDSKTRSHNTSETDVERGIGM